MRQQPRYQKGNKIGGRYLVHQALMGGMGEVYLCLDLQENLPYALKTFQSRFLSNLRLRSAFDSEVGIWIALERHPNIVRCFLMYAIDNQPFMLLEWIAGEETRGTDLRSWLRHGALNLRLALDFSLDICHGLIHAQTKQQGIVHRDLKPDNILVGPGPIAKITDFGLAKIVQDASLAIPNEENPLNRRMSLQGVSGIVGTPAYMAPEQWRGEELDSRTDIYALGCILYEMLTGQPPFSAMTRSGLRNKHLEAPIPTLTNGESKPAVLNTLLQRCLAKRKEERFATVQDFLQELKQIYRTQLGETPRIPVANEGFTASDYTNRGVTYENLKCYDQAFADFDRAIAIDPTFAPAYSYRGNTFKNFGRYENALENLHLAINIDPKFVEAYGFRAHTYKHLGRYEEALEDVKRAISIDPNLSANYGTRADIYDKLQRDDDALTDYTRAIQLDLNCVINYYNRGNFYRHRKRYSEALEDYTRAIQLDPHLEPAYVNRGRTYAHLQQYEKALADFDYAIEVHPTLSRVIQPHSRANAYNNRASVYGSLLRYEDAIRDYTCAIELNPDHVEAYLGRSSIYIQMERYDDALVDLMAIIEKDPTVAIAYFNRGWIYTYHLQRDDDGLKDFRRAVSLDPTLATRVYLCIGLVRFNRGGLKEAWGGLKAAWSLLKKGGETEPDPTRIIHPPDSAGRNE